jgi:hypothetical protein
LKGRTTRDERAPDSLYHGTPGSWPTPAPVTLLSLSDLDTYIRTQHITVAGKALANGLPVSSVLTTKTVIETPGTGIKGTFSKERASLAAAHDVLENDSVCKQLAATGQHTRSAGCRTGSRDRSQGSERMAHGYLESR